jgi:hypothetical protein
MGKMINSYEVVTRKPGGKRHRRRWEDNIKMGIRETGCEDVDEIHLV